MAANQGRHAPVAIPFYKPARSAQAWAWAYREARSGGLAGRYTKGPQHDLLVEELASFLGVNAERIILTGSGCTALAVAARALHDFYAPQPDCEMDVPAFSYRGTNLSMEMGGWTPYPQDVNPLTWCYRPDGSSISCTVDIFGNPAQAHVDSVVDAAHSLATADQRRRRGAVECFSLAATKLITGGEGGVIVVNRSAFVPGIEEHAALFSRLDEMSAALARWHLRHVDELLEARMPAWDHYAQHIPYRHQRMRKGFTPSVFGFLAPDREAFLQANEKSGVEFKLYYSDSDPPGDCPTASSIAKRIAAMPLYEDVPFKDAVDRLTFP